MNFKIKCALQWVFSTVPKGETLNFFFQKYYSKSIYEPGWFDNKVKRAKEHHEAFLKYNKLKENTQKYYEFGAGWDLIIPLYFGLKNFQVKTIDIRRLVFKELIENSLKNFNDKLNADIPVGNTQGMNDKQILEFIKEHCNVNYIAPLDARKTLIEANSIDFISSTATFEHIPKNDIISILNECYRILKPGAIVSAEIDYKDHWSYFDSSISCYNYLKFSENQWNKYNPPLHYQNRLRHPDYKDYIIAAGFEILEENTVSPDKEELTHLRNLRFDSNFEKYSEKDLAIKSATFVLRK